MSSDSTVTFIFVSIIIKTIVAKRLDFTTPPEANQDTEEHKIVADSEFPYVVAILKKTTYLSAGALVHDSWVVTAADSLYLLRESSRIIRIRLGSINHKKGGILTPIKYFQIHPYFDDNKPQYDIALIRLPQPARLTLNLNPIRLQPKRRIVSASHFLVTGWQTRGKVPNSEERGVRESLEGIKRRRMLFVSHLHPTYAEECSEQLRISGLNDTDNTLMCLDPAVGTDPCERQPGSPVVLNGVLWGIVSSWKPEDCETDPGPTYVVLVAAKNISSWIEATMRDKNYEP